MYVVYINLLYFLSIFLFTYNKNLLSPKKNNCNILRPNIAEIIPNNHNLILTMIITCMSTVKSLGQPRSYLY